MTAIPDAVLTSHTAILGKTGSGKTSTEKLAVEQVVAEGFRVCVLDSVKSDWWGITSSADGKRPGLPFKILGGPRGHVPLHSSAGKVIGQLVGSGQLPLSIIDMADFEPGGLQRFFVDFAPALMRSARGVLYLVIEEAHEFSPKERAGIGAENLAIHWAKKLATAGRSKGIRLIVATQRVQSLHNAVLGSCETIIAHRLTTPADQEPVIKWLKANTDKATLDRVASSLSSLPTGSAWLCSGEAAIFEQIAFPKFKTFDNTATPVADGEEIAVKTAPVDQDELRSLIGDAVKEAEANDPKLLRAEIQRLTKELAKRPGIDPAIADRAYKDGYDKGLIEGECHGQGAGQAVMLTRAQNALNALRVDTRPQEGPQTAETPPTSRDTTPPLPRPTTPVKSHTVANGADDVITGPQQRVLDALGWWLALGNPSPNIEQLAFVAGYSPTSGGFANIRGALRGRELVTYGAERQTSLTEAGAALAAAPAAPPSRGALQSLVLDKLTIPQRRVLFPLIEAWPNEMGNIALASLADYSPTSGGFANLRGSLRTIGCITYPGPGASRAADWLFP